MKEGIEYMMLSVSMGSAWKLLIAEYGHKAISVLFLVHQMIYAEKGYYTEWNEDRALLLTLAGTSLMSEEIQEVIQGAIKRNIFDKTLFETHGVLTSEEIQNHYFQVVKRRKVSGKAYKYLLNSGTNEVVAPAVPESATATEETLLITEEELANFAPFGDDYCILPKTSKEESMGISENLPSAQRSNKNLQPLGTVPKGCKF